VRAAFDKEDMRQIADMRRSGAVEGTAGVAPAEDLSNKIANTLKASTRLQKTYTPVNVASVIRFDEARAAGRRKMKGRSTPEHKPVKSVIGPGDGVS